MMLVAVDVVVTSNTGLRSSVVRFTSLDRLKPRPMKSGLGKEVHGLCGEAVAVGLAGSSILCDDVPADERQGVQSDVPA